MGRRQNEETKKKSFNIFLIVNRDSEILMPIGRKRKQKKSFNIFFIINKGRTRIAFPSVLAVKVTRKISNPQNLYRQIFSGRIDEIKKSLNRLKQYFPK